MPTDDNISNLASSTQPKPAGLTAAAPARVPAPAVFKPRPLETADQQAARQANEAAVASAGNGYVAPGKIDPNKQYYDPTAPNYADPYVASAQANVATGNYLPGAFSAEGWGDQQDVIHPNLDQGEAVAQRQRDFGLGAANNAQTAAMIGQAQATGDKYSSAFADVAGTDATNSAAAGSRGTAIYGGDTTQYQQGLQNAQQSRQMQTGSYDALMNFANRGPGPSAAQAQLQQSTDANTQTALALARSGRGMGGSQAATRQAISQNATTQQQANAQSAELRANENTAFQAQRLQALNAGAGVAGQTVAADQSYGQLGLAGAQYASDTALKGTQLNDASAQNWATQEGNAYQEGLGAEVGAQTQDLNINSTALTGRENEYASANQTYAAEKGFAQAASIADANRQQAYTGAALSTAGTVIGALSDEDAKTNIQPLSVVQPLASQSNGSVEGVTPMKTGPSQDEIDQQKRQQTGATVGKVGGAVAGSAIAGPIGGAVGSFVGSAIGKGLGKVFSDVRSKTNIQPLSAASAGGLSSTGEYLHGNYAAGKRDLDKANPYEELVAKYGAGGVADSTKAVTTYADQRAPTQKALGRFSRADHPILSEGDALLADSARSIPGSTYDYKDPTEPGAKPGRQVGPMAQDLAANPLTRNTVVKTKGGKLGVDTPRLTLYNTATQHGQQNQLDTLDSRIAELEGMLKRKPGDDRATSFQTSTGGL